MCSVGTPSTTDLGDVRSFLARRWLENAFLTRSLWSAVSDADCPGWTVVCRRGEQVGGVAVFWPVPSGDADGPERFDIEMDAVDGEAAGALAQCLPAGAAGHFRLFTLEAQRYFDACEAVESEPGDMYYTVSAEDFRRADGPDVVELTQADAALFDGCEQQPRWEHRDEEGRLFAVVRDGRVVASVSCTPITPHEAGRPRVVSVGALHTEPAYRRRGLGRRLASHATERVLRDGGLPIYWTAPDNVASRRLCKGLGFGRYAQIVTYVWRRSLREPPKQGSGRQPERGR
jgi:GNAT superfamily N-acetyltransferase